MGFEYWYAFYWRTVARVKALEREFSTARESKTI